MSSYIMHMGVSEIVKKKLKLTDKFILGSILPDNLKSITGDRDGTHYIEKIIIAGEERKLPNIKDALNKLDIQDKEIKSFLVYGIIESQENYEVLGLSKNFTILDSEDVLSIIKKILKNIFFPLAFRIGLVLYLFYNITRVL